MEMVAFWLFLPDVSCRTSSVLLAHLRHVVERVLILLVNLSKREGLELIPTIKCNSRNKWMRIQIGIHIYIYIHLLRKATPVIKSYQRNVQLYKWRSLRQCHYRFTWQMSYNLIVLYFLCHITWLNQSLLLILICLYRIISKGLSSRNFAIWFLSYQMYTHQHFE